MQELVSLIIDYPFMRHALIAAFLASIACGIVGTLVILNRLTFLAGGASHAAYGGIGIALYCRLPMLPCTLLFTLAAALCISAVGMDKEQEYRNAGSREAAAGVLWAAGMAIGIILISLTPGYAGELMGFLFGSILTVPLNDLIVMAAFDLLLIGIVGFFYQGIWAISLDKEFARTRGLPVDALYLLLVGLTAVTAVMLIRIVGLILVLALLTIPPIVARNITRTLPGTMLLAGLLSLLFSYTGLVLSWHWDIPSGPAIIAVSSAIYFPARLLRRHLRK